MPRQGATWASVSYNKKELLEMDNVELINAFEHIVEDMTKKANFSERGIPKKLYLAHEWARDELISRMR